MAATLETRPAAVKVIASKLEQPDLDNRSYRVIELPNRLEVLLVHDPDTDKASAAMDVHVGNYCDSDDLQGQAHAVEHLLFMGTKKYPKENAYSQYLSEHSGHSNAYTATSSTNYYFEVGHEHFYGALDRFAQFFISPLFLEETLDRELRAVDSENKKNLQNDTWRLHQLAKSLSNPKHPYCHFSTGNLQTLKELPAKRGINVRDEFMKFHAKYYSANLMKLVVLGRESLDELEKWVLELFSDVKNKDLPDPEFEGQPLTEEHLLTQIFAKPVMDTRSIDITFPFLDEKELWASHPSRYISHLIGHEGPGSILAYLKKKGWANGLNAGPSAVAKGSAFFTISIKLTEEGLEHYQEIITIIFHYINLLRDTPPQQWIVDELKAVAAVDFKFQEKSPASKFSSKVAAVMQQPYPRDWLLSSATLIREFKPDLIKEALGFLRPNNFRVMITARTPPSGEGFDKQEHWYGTEYRVEKIPQETLKKIQGTAVQGAGVGKGLEKELHLPHRNEFIPTNFTVQKKEVETPQKIPALIKNNDLARVWYKKDDTFWVPKANVYMCLRNPMVYATPGNMITTRIFCDLVKDDLGEYAYDAEISGLDYQISASSVGIEIELTGYNDKMSVLLEKVLTSMRDLEVKPDRFKVVKERTVRAYKNWIYQPPYYQVGEFTRYLNAPLMWLNDEILPELEELTMEDVKNFFPKLLQTFQVEALVHGNLYKEDALKYVDLVQAILEPKPLAPTQFNIRRSLIPPQGSRVVWCRPLRDENNVNSVIEYCLHVGEQRDRRLRMMLTLFAQLAEEPCFDQLRTKEQLGYVVFSGYRYGATTMGYRIIVQSERTAAYLESRVDNFLRELRAKIIEMSDKDFASHQKAVILKKTEKLKNLTQESNRYWNRIANEMYDFLQLDEDVECLKEVTQEDIITFFDTYINPGSTKGTKASIQMTATGTTEAKRTAFLKTLSESLASSISLTIAPAELEPVFASVNVTKPEDVATALRGFLTSQRAVDAAKVDTAVKEAEKANAVAVEVARSEEFSPEQFGEVLENVVEWKAGCMVTAGARPVKPLVEYEENESKL
ncbi:LuxS/MPP-like metallohydrolase [Ascodesmis nigricans]|uniref:LuxS/MPP-like metallohydrolase n=1 Tax=Ascodesmis nigricans TaxID=341454 RepID=A0A4S2MQS9_9PEZI|nr:LuxS/MPP-like metallohydrolase [Ascodesmis nigricans]